MAILTQLPCTFGVMSQFDMLCLCTDPLGHPPCLVLVCLLARLNFSTVVLAHSPVLWPLVHLQSLDSDLLSSRGLKNCYKLPQMDAILQDLEPAASSCMRKCCYHHLLSLSQPREGTEVDWVLPWALWWYTCVCVRVEGGTEMDI